MAQDIKQDIFFYGAMNSDDMPEIISDGNYLLAVDISNKSNDADNKIGKVVPRKGNELIDNPFYETLVFYKDNFLPPVERYTVGSVRDESSNKIYYFVYERFGIEGVGQRRFWSIYEFDAVAKQITNQVCRVEIQIFDQTKSVKWGQVLYGNLFWVQDGIEPKSINIEKAINHTKNLLLEVSVDTFFKPSYPSLTMREFNVIKRPPTVLIEGTYGSNPDVLTNNIRGRLFQFRYRYVYRDNTESVWSPISKVVLPDGEVNADGVWSTSNNYNFIRLAYTVDTVEVKEVQIAKREYDGDTNIPTLFEVIHKEEIKLSNSNYVCDYSFPKFYEFFNDVAGDTLSEREENALYDVVPLSATSMEVISNPDKIVYGGDIVEPSSRDNITTNVSLEVTRFSVADIAEVNEDTGLWDDFPQENIRTALNPYHIEGGALIKDFHFNRLGTYTAIYIPDGYTGTNLQLSFKYTSQGGVVKQYNKTINIDGLTTQEEIRDRIAEALNDHVPGCAFKTKAAFESAATDVTGTFHDPVTEDKWRYTDWAFSTLDNNHPFQGYNPYNNDSSWLLDTSVVTIHTGKLLEDEGATFVEMLMDTKNLSAASTPANRNTARAAGNYIGNAILRNDNLLFDVIPSNSYLTLPPLDDGFYNVELSLF